MGGAGGAQPILGPPQGCWTWDLTGPDNSPLVLTRVAFTGEDKWHRASPAFLHWILTLHTRCMGPKSSPNNGTPIPQEERCSQGRGSGSVGHPFVHVALEDRDSREGLGSALEGTPFTQRLRVTSRGRPLPSGAPLESQREHTAGTKPRTLGSAGPIWSLLAVAVIVASFQDETWNCQDPPVPGP